MQKLYKPVFCRIQISGELDPIRVSSMYEMDFTYSVDENQNAITTLEGHLPDYSALYGILNYMYGLGIRLISVQVS